MKLPVFKSWNAAALFLAICFFTPFTGVIAFRTILSLSSPVEVQNVRR